MSDFDPWGSLDETPRVRIPKEFLQDAARLLEKKTAGVVRGRVTSHQESDRMAATLEVYSPKNEKLRKALVTLVYSLDLYPLQLRSHCHKGSEPKFVVQVKSEDELKDQLRRLLSGPDAHHYVALPAFVWVARAGPVQAEAGKPLRNGVLRSGAVVRRARHGSWPPPFPGAALLAERLAGTVACSFSAPTRIPEDPTM